MIVTMSSSFTIIYLLMFFFFFVNDDYMVLKIHMAGESHWNHRIPWDDHSTEAMDTCPEETNKMLMMGAEM